MSHLVDWATGVSQIFSGPKNTGKTSNNVRLELRTHLKYPTTNCPQINGNWHQMANMETSFCVFFFNLLILWTVCRDWWLTQLYPAPTASQVTRHLGLAETAAHRVGWKCFNRDVETVEKCIILHIATKNCTFLRVQIFCMMTVMTWRMISRVQSNGRRSGRFFLTRRGRFDGICIRICKNLLLYFISVVS